MSALPEAERREVAACRVEQFLLLVEQPLEGGMAAIVQHRIGIGQGWDHSLERPERADDAPERPVRCRVCIEEMRRRGADQIVQPRVRVGMRAGAAAFQAPAGLIEDDGYEIGREQAGLDPLFGRRGLQCEDVLPILGLRLDHAPKR